MTEKKMREWLASLVLAGCDRVRVLELAIELAAEDRAGDGYTFASRPAKLVEEPGGGSHAEVSTLSREEEAIVIYHRLVGAILLGAEVK